MSAGGFIKEARRKNGLTIREVVLMTGDEIDKTTISRIERGERKISLKAGYYFSRIYGIPLEEMAKREMGAKAKIKEVKIEKKKRGRKKGSTAKKRAAKKK
jgi:transcriptional regulator with XRE-family HTH domain